MYLRRGLKVNDRGRLEIGGCDAADLAREFGTPLYVVDEDFLRGACREYTTAARKFYGGETSVCYASKAFCCKEIYRVAMSEGLGADTVSGGELYTALSAGFPADKIYMHGNNKTETELTEAAAAGIRAVVADGFSEMALLKKVAARLKKDINVVVRVNPGIEAHTHEFTRTARPDSKFGFLLSDGSALAAAGEVINSERLKFAGLHCHIGSQIFELKPYELAASALTALAGEIKKKHGVSAAEIILGGGAGIKYTDEDNPPSITEFVKAAARAVEAGAKAAGLSPLPRLGLEPGRSIVGEAGITLYAAGAVKEIAGIKKYVCIDGGMFDNPRYALYRSKYAAALANKMRAEATETVTIAGKCCESGDIIIDGARLPAVERGDIIAVFATGAYNFSMASNYNRNAVPPVVFAAGGKARYAVRPQTYADLAARDV